jgi:hypothetical protein
MNRGAQTIGLPALHDHQDHGAAGDGPAPHALDLTSLKLTTRPGRELRDEIDEFRADPLQQPMLFREGL